MGETNNVLLILYALIGICGALSSIVFIRGFITYISRLGTERRAEGIDIMEWGVGFIITAIALIGVLRLYTWWTAAL